MAYRGKYTGGASPELLLGEKAYLSATSEHLSETAT